MSPVSILLDEVEGMGHSHVGRRSQRRGALRLLYMLCYGYGADCPQLENEEHRLEPYHRRYLHCVLFHNMIRRWLRLVSILPQARRVKI